MNNPNSKDIFFYGPKRNQVKLKITDVVKEIIFSYCAEDGNREEVIHQVNYNNTNYETIDDGITITTVAQVLYGETMCYTPFKLDIINKEGKVIVDKVEILARRFESIIPGENPLEEDIAGYDESDISVRLITVGLSYTLKENQNVEYNLNNFGGDKVQHTTLALPICLNEDDENQDEMIHVGYLGDVDGKVFEQVVEEFNVGEIIHQDDFIVHIQLPTHLHDNPYAMKECVNMFKTFYQLRENMSTLAKEAMMFIKHLG